MMLRQRTFEKVLCQFQQAIAWEMRREPVISYAMPSSCRIEEGFFIAKIQGGYIND